MTDTKRCEVCGDRIRRDNNHGVCTNGSKPECVEARNRKRRAQAAESRPLPTRFCEVCGDPILARNTSGICSGRSNPGCRAALRRKWLDRTQPAPKHCEICGVPIRPNNKYGICSDQTKPACWRARWLKREGRSESDRKYCKVCGDPLNFDNKYGVCSDRTRPECLRVRHRAERGVADPMGHAHRVTIKAGDTFGRWTALEDYSASARRVLVRCDCGAVRRVTGTKLNNGETFSCGCARYETRGRNKPPYLTATAVFGRLTVLEDVPTCDDRVRCRCECGTEKTILAVSVKLGATRSCGCLASTLGGFTKHPLYSTWASMMQRCTNPNVQGYGNYGGRGITVCDRWRNDPWAFAEDVLREIGPRPEDRDENGRVLYEFDRTDNESGYGPGNVRWSDKKTQRANQRTVADLTRERAVLAVKAAQADALAAELAALKASLAPRKRRALPLPADALF
jgi:predicted nucleic acid-binding Zn ribbon protein